jgi:hypothetical protein
MMSRRLPILFLVLLVVIAGCTPSLMDKSEELTKLREGSETIAFDKIEQTLGPGRKVTEAQFIEYNTRAVGSLGIQSDDSVDNAEKLEFWAWESGKNFVAIAYDPGAQKIVKETHKLKR